MKVMVVGATGVVGRPLLRALVEAGHAVVATSRRPPDIALKGVEGRTLDLLDAEATRSLVAHVVPDAIIHQATALKALGNNLRRFDKQFETTNRLRVEGTTTLIEAARCLDEPPQIVAQSFCGWPWAPEGHRVKSEGDPLDPDPAPAFRRTFAAIVAMESVLAGYERGVVLRYGALYGPGTSLGPGGDQIEAIRKRGFPLVGDAGATWSFLHVADAADAAVAALTAPPGVYNVVDDTPVRLGDWLTEVAAMMSAPPPRRVPVWLAALAGGRGLVHMMTTARGSSNAHARTTLGWSPGHPTWREGFAEMLGTDPAEPDRHARS
jgi:nucleoside-diphosphate-sugar epimerase